MYFATEVRHYLTLCVLNRTFPFGNLVLDDQQVGEVYLKLEISKRKTSILLLFIWVVNTLELILMILKFIDLICSAPFICILECPRVNDKTVENLIRFGTSTSLIYLIKRMFCSPMRFITLPTNQTEFGSTNRIIRFVKTV